MIRKRCECEAGDHITPDVACHYHVDQEFYAALVNRVASRILRASLPVSGERDA